MKIHLSTRTYVSVSFLYLADQFILFVVPLILYARTGSVEISSLAYAAEWTVRILGGLFAKRAAENMGAPQALFLTELLRAVVAVVFVLELSLLPFSPWVVALVGCSFAFLNSLAMVALNTFLAQTFKGDAFAKVDSLVGTIDQISLLVGPALAAVLWGTLPEVGVPLTACLLLFIAAVSFKRISSSSEPVSIDGKGDVPGFSLRDAHSLVWSDWGLRGCLVSAIFINGIVGMSEAIGPYVLTDKLAKGAGWLALMNTTAGVLGVLVLPACPKWVNRYGGIPVWWTSHLLVLGGALVLTTAGTPWLWTMGFGLTIAGALIGGVGYRTYRARVVPSAQLAAVVSYMWSVGQVGSVAFSGMISVVSGWADAQSQVLIVATPLLLWWVAMVPRAKISPACSPKSPN